MENAKKLFIFGDSVMKGVVYDGEKYSLCENRDFEEIEKLGVEVVNKSKMGATIDKGSAVFEKNISVPEKQDAIILEYGGNDCDHDWKQISQTPSPDNGPNIALKSFTEKYRALIRKAKSTGAKVFISNLVPLDPEKFFSFITKGLSSENIMKFLGDITMLYRWQEYYDNAICRLAVEENCEIIDIRTPFLMSHEYKELMCADGIHPTNKGHELIERVLKNELQVKLGA